VVSAGKAGLCASHVPVLHRPNRTDAGELWLHLARANPQCVDLDAGGETLAIFHGPHAYVSPRWYRDQPSVPTWNFAAVHVYGRPRRVTNATELRALVAALVDAQESSSAAPWRLEEQPEDYLSGMLRGIAGYRLVIERVEGKVKMSQNRSAVDRRGVVAALAESPRPGDRETAEMMARLESTGRPTS
jgi:transcriptional regulator